MKTDDIVDAFITGRIHIVANRDTEKLNAIITGLKNIGTVTDLLPILIDQPDTIEFIKRIATEVNVPNTTLFVTILRNLNAAVPASDPLDVLL